MATTADGALVEAARAGDQRAFGLLFDTWFDRVHDVSRRIVHDDGIAGEVAQDTFLRAWTKLDTLDDVDAFGGWVLRIGRNASLNRLEKERRSTVLDDESMTAVTDAGAPDHDPLARMDQAARIALVWDAAAALGERDASVLDLHLRHGLGAAELADELGVTANNANQLIFRMKKRLAAGIRAWVLVRGGRSTCPALAAALEAADVHEFGRAAVGVVDDHVAQCDDCRDRQAAVLDPAALFAAAPIAAMAPALRATVSEGLRSAGVPVAVEVAPPATHHRRLQRRRAALVGLAATHLVVAAILSVLAGQRSDDQQQVASAAASSSSLDGTRAEATTGPTAPTSVGSQPAPVPTDPTGTEATAAPSSSTVPSEPRVGTTSPSGPVIAPPTATTATPTPQSTPTTTRPATTTTSPTAPPVVRRFSAVAATSPGGACPPARWATTLWWSVDDATTATIEAQGVSPLTGLAPSGRRTVCRFSASAPSGGWKLTATGPGGTSTATA